MVAVDRGFDVQPAVAAGALFAGAEAAFDTGGRFVLGGGGEESADLVHHPAQVLGVDQRGQLGADQFLGVAAVDTGGGRADVSEHTGRGGDHDDVAGALHQGAEVVLLLRQFLGEGDVVEQHDALADDQRQDDRAAGEEHHAVDAPSVQDVGEDAQGADGGGEVRGQCGERARDGAAAVRLDPAGGGLGLLLGGLVTPTAGDPGRVREQHRAGEPSGVQDLPGAVVLAQQWRAEQGVAQDGQRQCGDGGVDGRAVHRGAPEVQREHHAHQHDVEQGVGQ